MTEKTNPNEALKQLSAEEREELIGLVCFSGGKDSTAMLLRLLELDDPSMPVNRIVFADTGFEFPELLEYMNKVMEYINTKYPEKNLELEMVGSPRSWDDWFYGVMQRGANKGKQRGAPLRAYPCYWASEAKVQPLQKVAEEADIAYIGIAADEAHRVGKEDDPRNAKNRYPLVEWGWSEDDCIKYLDSLEMVNELYVHFDRLGCFHCIKQPLDSWWNLWRGYPEFWEIAKHWDKESVRVSNHGLRSMKPGEDGYLLEELEERFKQGYRPDPLKKGKFDCKSCKAVAFTAVGQLKLEDFNIENAPELMDKKFIDIEPTADEMMLEPEETCDIVGGSFDED